MLKPRQPGWTARQLTVTTTGTSLRWPFLVISKSCVWKKVEYADAVLSLVTSWKSRFSPPKFTPLKQALMLLTVIVACEHGPISDVWTGFYFLSLFWFNLPASSYSWLINSCIRQLIDVNSFLRGVFYNISACMMEVRQVNQSIIYVVWYHSVQDVMTPCLSSYSAHILASKQTSF